MKTFKRPISLILAASMVLGSAVTVFADEEEIITEETQETEEKEEDQDTEETVSEENSTENWEDEDLNDIDIEEAEEIDNADVEEEETEEVLDDCGISINELNFPDEKFRKYVKENFDYGEVEGVLCPDEGHAQIALV